MENNETVDPSRFEEGNKVTGGSDQEYLRKAEEQLPDANKSAEDTDELAGDIHPAERSETAQGELNTDSENQSDSSKISGEVL